MERHSRAVRRYLREIRGWLPCSGKLKRGILERIEHTIQEYLAENQNASYEELTERFGMPQQIAASYVEEMGTDELLRDLRIRRKIMKIVAATAAVAFILWAGYLTIALIDVHENVNGYGGYGEVTVIERTETSERGE